MSPLDHTDRIDVAAQENLSTSNGLVMPRENQSVSAEGPALKTLEIAEFADVYFFHPLGSALARAARALQITPAQVTILGALVGVAGGALLYNESLGLFAFALLIVHGIIDSADGQLARLTGQVTELGRVLDGASGYITHGAIYIAIAAGIINRGGNETLLFWMVPAALSNALQAQMYDYHRLAFVAVVRDGRPLTNDPTDVPSWARWLYNPYLRVQQGLVASHRKVEAALAARSVANRVREEDRTRYQDCFRLPVRGWNLLGDNTRFYAIGILACFHRVDLFFAFILIPMNLAFIALWFWQRSADKKFLAGI